MFYILTTLNLLLPSLYMRKYKYMDAMTLILFAKNKLINQLKCPDILQLNFCHYKDSKEEVFKIVSIFIIFIIVIFIRKKFTLKYVSKKNLLLGK